jgi:hypothetical protein
VFPRAGSLLLVLIVGLAGCVPIDQSVFPQRAATQDRYVQATVERVGGVLSPWLEQHHCSLAARSEQGVTWMACTAVSGQRFRVVLTPWENNNVIFTRIHVEGDEESEVPGVLMVQLLQFIDSLNDGTPATSLRQAKQEPRQVGKQASSEEGRVLERIKKLRGTVVRDTTQPGSPVIAVDLHATRATDEDVAMLHVFPTVMRLNLYGTRISDAGLVHLTALPGLQTLYLNQTEISDAALDRLCGLKNLHELGLYHTHVTDRGLEKLKGVLSLQQLTLSGKQITDAGLVHIKQMTNLHQLNIHDTAITDAGIADLKKRLPHLIVLR